MILITHLLVLLVDKVVSEVDYLDEVACLFDLVLEVLNIGLHI